MLTSTAVAAGSRQCGALGCGVSCSSAHAGTTESKRWVGITDLTPFLLSPSLTVCYLLKSNISPDLCNEDGLTALHQVRRGRRSQLPARHFFPLPSEQTCRGGQKQTAISFCCSVKAVKLHHVVLVILFLGEQTEIKPFSCCIPDFVQ